MKKKIAYTAKEVAEMLSIGLPQVRRHTTQGLFPHHRIGSKSIRYTQPDIDKYLERWENSGYSY